MVNAHGLMAAHRFLDDGFVVSLVQFNEWVVCDERSLDVVDCGRLQVEELVHG